MTKTNWTHTIVVCICFLSLPFPHHNSLTVDELQAKVALIHDEERVLSEDEAVVSFFFIHMVYNTMLAGAVKG